MECIIVVCSTGLTPAKSQFQDISRSSMEFLASARIHYNKALELYNDGEQYKAVKWLRKAAEQGNNKACDALKRIEEET